jgi:hypothetical protein
MSHQGYEGWFPECIVCHCGNLGPVVCLDPTCHEAQGLRPVTPKQTRIHGDLHDDELLVKEDGHWWKCCQLCDKRIHSDPGAFGSYAICVRCFNQCVARGEWPPSAPWTVKIPRR